MQDTSVDRRSVPYRQQRATGIELVLDVLSFCMDETVESVSADSFTDRSVEDAERLDAIAIIENLDAESRLMRK